MSTEHINPMLTRYKDKYAPVIIDCKGWWVYLKIYHRLQKAKMVLMYMIKGDVQSS